MEKEKKVQHMLPLSMYINNNNKNTLSKKTGKIVFVSEKEQHFQSNSTPIYSSAWNPLLQCFQDYYSANLYQNYLSMCLSSSLDYIKSVI